MSHITSDEDEYIPEMVNPEDSDAEQEMIIESEESDNSDEDIKI